MLISEQRFREGSGEKYLKNGEVRCQAVSKTQVYRYRLEHNDEITPTDALWPECQCAKPAEPGRFVCYYHGGKTPRKNPVNNIYDVIPIDLGEKVKLLMNDPSYISRRENMAVLRARQWEILEKLQSRDNSEEAWGNVADALYELQHGNEEIATNLIKEALTSQSDSQNLWKEYYEVDKLLNNATTTEVKTAKELQSMATVEQVGRLMSRIYDVLTISAEKYIEDKHQQSAFLRYVAGELNRATNFSPAAAIGLLDAGSGEED